MVRGPGSGKIHGPGSAMALYPGSSKVQGPVTGMVLGPYVDSGPHSILYNFSGNIVQSCIVCSHSFAQPQHNSKLS